MHNLFLYGLIIFVIASCNPEANKIPPCFNGVKDGNETGIDCGGPDCDPCEISCIDQLLNGDEEGVDCGGTICNVCNPIVNEFSANIDGASFANSVNSVDLVNKVFHISGISNNVSLTVMIPADINPGSYEIPTDEDIGGAVSDGSVVPPLFYTASSGVIVITTHDKVNKTVKGTFEFIGTASGGETIVVSNGSFRFTY